LAGLQDVSTDGLTNLESARAFRGAPRPAPPNSTDVEVALNEPEGELEVSTPQPGGPRRNRWGVLRHKDYRNVWFGQFGSSIGGWLEQVGVSWIINVHSQDPALALSYLAAAQLGPTMFFGIPGGILADRVNRRMLLLVTQFMMMLIAGGLAITSYLGHNEPNVTILVLLVCLNGITIPFNNPAWQVLTPRLVPREELTSAIFLNGLQFNLARVIGPAIGGLLLAWTGPTILFVINTISFLGVLVAVWSTPNTPTPPRTEKTVWHQVAEAFKFMWHDRGPRAVLIAIIVFGLLAAPLMRFLPMFVTKVFTQTIDLDKSHQERWYGILLAMLGIGAASGVGLVRLVPKWYPKHHLLPVSMLGAGVGISLFAATTNAYLACAALLLSGVFWLWTFNTGFAAVQILVPDAMRGRVMAVLNVAVFGSMALGPFITGNLGSDLNSASTTITAGLGIRIGVAATGVALVIAALVMLHWRTPEVDGLKPGDVGYERRPGLISGFSASVHRPAQGPRCPVCDYVVSKLPIQDGAVTCPECGTRTPVEKLRGQAGYRPL
jgi:MFS family permease